jgi:hypothetical protein
MEVSYEVQEERTNITIHHLYTRSQNSRVQHQYDMNGEKQEKKLFSTDISSQAWGL